MRTPRDGDRYARDIDSLFPREVAARLRAPSAAHNQRIALLRAHVRRAAAGHFALRGGRSPQ